MNDTQTLDRVLPAAALTTLDEYRDHGGGRGLERARRLSPREVTDVVAASGLRGRGGAGFPTGRKWSTVTANHSDLLASTVAVNAAEGEPGTFKDRAILRSNPYAVLEGALIAAHAVGANQVIVALKRSFERSIRRVDEAIGEIERAGWSEGVEVAIFEGPSEYLFGEETALLECIDGRHPFPRIAPPFRRGVVEIVDDLRALDSESSSAAHVQMAGPSSALVAPPALVNNTETLANVPAIVANGPEWFRELGTDDSPGTVVCTVTGRTRRHGVAELAMGTPLRDAIDLIGDGPEPGHAIKAVLSGVANSLVPAALLDTPISYEGMQAIGSGVGAAGFIVFDDTTDLVAVAAEVSRFLAVESCGQCTPCKQDGLILADRLRALQADDALDTDLDTILMRLRHITRGARCYLASQHQVVVESILELFPDEVAAHLAGREHDGPHPRILPIVDIVDDRAVLDLGHLHKQPDWTYGPTFSGRSPADRLDDHRVPVAREEIVGTSLH